MEKECVSFIYRMVQKSLDTICNVLNIECQVTYAPSCILLYLKTPPCILLYLKKTPPCILLYLKNVILYIVIFKKLHNL